MSTNAIIENTVALATRMEPLITKDRTKLEARLEAGVIDGMKADLTVTKAESTAAVLARQFKSAATLSQDELAATIRVLVQAVRNGCKEKRLAPAVLTKVGVGKAINVKSVKSVTDAADSVVKCYQEHTDELRRAGVLPSDIDRITALRDRLAVTDTDQEHQKTTSKDQTKARNEAHKRLVTAMAAIIGAAELAFATEPERLEMYRALCPTRSTPKKPAAPQA